MKTKIKANLLAFSENIQGDRLFTYELLFPRIILSELNTHRESSKSTSSSRAVPFNKMIKMVKNDPFIPYAWQKEHKGMQGKDYFEQPLDIQGNELLWLEARDNAVKTAELYSKIGVSKQIINRLLEPFMWVKMVFTISEPGLLNLFNLRCPQYLVALDDRNLTFKSRKEVCKYYDIEDEFTDLQWLKSNIGTAEIHFSLLAEQMYDLYIEALKKGSNAVLEGGQWHIPYKEKVLEMFPDSTLEEIIKIATILCARTSYTILESDVNKPKEYFLELYDKLVNENPPHHSPMQHILRCMTDNEYNLFARGNVLYDNVHKGFSISKETLGWCYNNKGFIQLRYLLENNLNIL